MSAELSPISPGEQFRSQEAAAAERFFSDPDAIQDEDFWRTPEAGIEFRDKVEERLRRNHPDLAPKYDGTNELYSLEGAMMQTAAWQIMIVRENRWRRERRVDNRGSLIILCS